MGVTVFHGLRLLTLTLKPCPLVHILALAQVEGLQGTKKDLQRSQAM